MKEKAFISRMSKTGCAIKRNSRHSGKPAGKLSIGTTLCQTRKALSRR
jgi:hypothetical protein